MEIKRFEFNMFPVNCYVVWDETCEGVIIDPGCYYDDEREALRRFVADHGLTIRHLLNTHLHLDHIFGNPFVGREWGMRAEAHQADEFLLAQAEAQGRMFGVHLPEPMEPLGGYIHDGDMISFGHSQLEAIHVPGHSPGSIVFYAAEAHCLFSGDVLFAGSIGRADLAGGDFDQLITHICSRLLPLPDDTVVYPGHGGPTTIGNERAYNPFLRG